MNWHILHEKIVPYLVMIETQDGYGSGFLFAYNNTKVMMAIATASHVVKQAREWQQPIKVSHYKTGTEVFLEASKRVILLNKEKDTASILLKSGSIDFPEETLPLMDATKFKKVGSEVAWVGFPSVAHPELCFFTGTVSAFLFEDDCYLIDGVAINGVSGGPVFTDLGADTPEIIGTVSAYMPNRVGGATLPGLLRAQDISPFTDTIKTLRDLDEATEKEKEKEKEIEKEKEASRGEQSEASGAQPGSLPPSTNPSSEGLS